MTEHPYKVEFLGPARRAIAEHLPPSVAFAVLGYCEDSLASNPRWAGKPLVGPLAGCYGARRATYRIVYRIDDDLHVVQVLDIAHRRGIYGPRQR